jgi:hypothetical protein
VRIASTPGVGADTIDQAEPFQRSTSVRIPSSVTDHPTAHRSSGATATTSRSIEDVPASGLGTIRQATPSLRSISGTKSCPIWWRPTAQIAFGETTATPARPSSFGPGSAIGIARQVVPSNVTAIGEKSASAPTAHARPPATAMSSSWVALPPATSRARAS